MKAKFKPVAKAEIRERVESKFRARGAVRFHLLLMLCAGILLLYNLPTLWPPTSGWDLDALLVYTALYGFLGTSGALHYIRYYFRHGRGRERHEAETLRLVKAQLRGAAAEDLEEQEELLRLQMVDKLKNRRLLFWHLALYLGVMTSIVFLHPLNTGALFRPDPDFWRGPLILASIWGTGLGAHVLRYFFAYGGRWAKREAKIDQLVERELRRDRRGRTSAERVRADSDVGNIMADVKSVSRQADAQSEQAR